MEILGIGPGEFVLILILLLVVVGPERLPGLARQAGSVLVRARNWLQTSPDAALVLRARQEIEAELAALKSNLLEVQNVRDEVLGAAKQLEDSVGSIASAKVDLNSLMNPTGTVSRTSAFSQFAPAAAAEPEPQLVLPDGTPALASDAEPISLELPNGTTTTVLPADQAAPAVQAPVMAPASSAPALQPLVTPSSDGMRSGDLASINLRLGAIMSDLWALQDQLKQSGALESNWQPPSSNTIQPAPAAAATPVAAPAPAAPVRDPFAPLSVDYFSPPPPPTPAPVPAADEPYPAPSAADTGYPSANAHEQPLSDSEQPAPAGESDLYPAPTANSAAAAAGAEHEQPLSTSETDLYPAPSAAERADPSPSESDYYPAPSAAGALDASTEHEQPLSSSSEAMPNSPDIIPPAYIPADAAIPAGIALNNQSLSGAATEERSGFKKRKRRTPESTPPDNSETVATEEAS